MMIHVLSGAAPKVDAAQQLAAYLNRSKTQDEVRVRECGRYHGRILMGRTLMDTARGTTFSVEQPYGEETYEACVSRIRGFMMSEREMIGESDIIIAFESGIYFDYDAESNRASNPYDVCVMVVEQNGKRTRYNSFGIAIDDNLFAEYQAQCPSVTDPQTFTTGPIMTYGQFLQEKFGVDHRNWMKDIRFGNVDRSVQIASCINKYLIDISVTTIPDYPRPGVCFKDITPVMSDSDLLQLLHVELNRAIDNAFDLKNIDYIAGLDARGFYFAPHIAVAAHKGFIPVRKAPKVPVPHTDRGDPSKFVTEDYETEYSDDSFGLIPRPEYAGKRVLIVDDLLATGGSVMAANSVLTKAGLSCVGAVAIYDVEALRCDAYEKLGIPMLTLVQPNCEPANFVECRSFAKDVKSVEYPIPEIMLCRIKASEPKHIDLGASDYDGSGAAGTAGTAGAVDHVAIDITSSDVSDDSIRPMGSLSRKYTLSSAEWAGPIPRPNKMDGVKIVYAGRDADYATKIIERLAALDGTCDRDEAVSKYGVQVNAGRFGNGESHVFIDQNFRKHNVYIVSRIRTGHINDDLQELCLIMDACNRSGAKEKNIVIPYYAYSRSDKKDAPRTSIGAAVVAGHLKALKMETTFSVDLHAGQIQGFFEGGFHNLYMKKYIAEYAWANYLRYHPISAWNEKFVLIAPDAGSTKAIKDYSAIFGINNIALDKSRDYQAAEKGGSAVAKIRFIGDREQFAGRTGLIIDDIGDTMGTMSAAVSELVENGLSAAIIFLTHGVLSGPAIERINSNPYIKEVVVSDTLPQEHNIERCPKLRVVTSTELIARAIDGELTGRSVSRLFH